MATGTISGTVKVGTEAGAPASNSIVRAYDRITGTMAAEVTSDVNGEFTITVPDFSRVYTLTAINNSFPGYNAGIDDNKYGTEDTLVICDIYFNDVLLLLNGQDTLTKDHSMFNRTLLTVGTPTLDSSNSLFNYPSYKIDSGVTEYVGISNDQFIPQALRKGEWCIELWVKPVLSGIGTVFASFSQFIFRWLSTNNFSVSCTNIGGSSFTLATTTNIYTANQWYHLAFVRDNNTSTINGNLKLYINGILVLTSAAISKAAAISLTAGAGRFIGYSNTDASGYFSNLRVTKRIARYYANFDVPTAPFETTQCVIDPAFSVKTFNISVLKENTDIIENFSNGLNDWRVWVYDANYSSNKYLYFSIDDSIYGKAVKTNWTTWVSPSRSDIRIPLRPKVVSNILFKIFIITQGNESTSGNGGLQVYFRKIRGYNNIDWNNAAHIIKLASGNYTPLAPVFTAWSGTGTSVNYKINNTTLTANNWYQFDYRLVSSPGVSTLTITNITTGALVQATQLTNASEGPQIFSEMCVQFVGINPNIPQNIKLADIVLR